MKLVHLIKTLECQLEYFKDDKVKSEEIKNKLKEIKKQRL